VIQKMKNHDTKHDTKHDTAIKNHLRINVSG